MRAGKLVLGYLLVLMAFASSARQYSHEKIKAMNEPSVLLELPEECRLNVSAAALTMPGSTYRPRPISGKDYNFVAYREELLYTPFLPPINTNIIPFSPNLPVTYNTEAPCRAADAHRCAACIALTHSEAPYGCYCPVKVKARIRAAHGWAPTRHDKPLDRYGYPAEAYQGPNIFAPPLELYPTAPLPSVEEGVKFGIIAFSQGSGSCDAFTFQNGDVIAGHSDLNMAALDIEFHPNDVYAKAGTMAEETAMSNRVEVMRLIVNTFIEHANSGEGQFAEWKGLFNGNKTPVVQSGWSLGGLTVLLNRLGLAAANILSWVQCQLANQCLGSLVLDMPFDPTSEAIPDELLLEYDAPLFAFAGQSLGPVQALPVFYANANLDVNYVVMDDFTTHDDSSAQSGLTVLTVQKELGVNPDFVGWDADYLYPNATAVMGPALRNNLWMQVAALAWHVFGLQEYRPYLLTCNAERMEGVDFWHIPIGNVCATFNNTKLILQERSVYGQSSYSSASGVISSLEYHSEYVARPFLCIADPPIPLSSLSPALALNLTRQEWAGHFPHGLCSTTCPPPGY